MPEKLLASDINSKTDPSVSKQYDNEAPISKQIEDLYTIVDNAKICMLTTQRKNIGPVGRMMAINREGSKYLFLSNKQSKKFQDLSETKEVQITIQDNKNYDWVSITGVATSTSNDDPRIKDLYSPAISAWFGDLGDGIHKGNADDPRMALIEVKPKYVVYWKTEVGTLGFVKEIAQSVITGAVAHTGVIRELSEKDFE